LTRHNTLFFEKISKFDRTEPLSFAVPFAQGKCLDASSLVSCQVSSCGRAIALSPRRSLDFSTTVPGADDSQSTPSN